MAIHSLLTLQALHGELLIPHFAMLLTTIFLISILIFWLIYRLLFSPISTVPGPWYTKLSGLFVVYHDFNGTKRLWIHGLHLKYGEVVRLAPDEVSFASPRAIKEIYIASGGYVKTELYSLFTQDNHRNLFTALDKKEVSSAAQMNMCKELTNPPSSTMRRKKGLQIDTPTRLSYSPMSRSLYASELKRSLESAHRIKAWMSM